MLVILLHMISKHRYEQEKCTKYEKIFMDCGTNNSRRYINVTEICEALQTKVPGSPKALPALHAMTGTDVTAAFYHKGKVLALNLMLRDPSLKFVDYFGSLSTASIEDVPIAEEFVCCLYGLSDHSNINEARAKKLFQMTGFDGKSKAKKETLRKVRKVNCCLLPPCRNVLENKLRRVNYVSQVWGRADERKPTEFISPENYGWRITDRRYVPSWYDGPTLPAELQKKPDLSMEPTEDEVWSDDSDEDDVQ